jgi:thiol-disulfide isomerase/thioredoxin
MMPGIAVRAVALWAVVVAVLGGLSYFTRALPPPGTIDAAIDARAIGLTKMVDLEGEAVLKAGWGGQLTIVNFWATWCRPCLLEVPDLIALQDEFRNELAVIGLAVDEPDPARLRAFVSSTGMNYPIVEVTPAISDLFPGVSALPTSFLVDRKGRLAGRIVGQLDPNAVRAWIQSSLALDDGRGP